MVLVLFQLTFSFRNLPVAIENVEWDYCPEGSSGRVIAYFCVGESNLKIKPLKPGASAACSSILQSTLV